MLGLLLPRIVVDTNIVFEGLTKQGGASGLIMDAWLAGLMVVCVSNAPMNMMMCCLESSQKNVGVGYNLSWGNS
jgi:predicted nucleic acid-binding protein